MPYPGTRINQETTALSANGMSGGASFYEVKFSDATKPNGQIWAGVVGPSGPNVPPAAANQRWFVVWLGTGNDPVDKAGAKTLAESVLPLLAPGGSAPAPGAPAPAPASGRTAPLPRAHPPRPRSWAHRPRRLPRALPRRAPRRARTRHHRPDSRPAVTALRRLPARSRPSASCPAQAPIARMNNYAEVGIPSCRSRSGLGRLTTRSPDERHGSDRESGFGYADRRRLDRLHHHRRYRRLARQQSRQRHWLGHHCWTSSSG